MLGTLLALLADNAAGALLRVVGFSLLFLGLGASVGAIAVVIARRRGFLRDLPWPRRSVFVLWAVAVPALMSIEGAFVGAGRAAAHIVEANHLTEKIAGAAVHGVVDVVFRDPRARALLDEGRFPIGETEALFELLPQALGHAALERVEHAVRARAGDGIVAIVAIRFAQLGIGVVAASSSLARAAWATPVVEALYGTDDGDGTASLAELGNAIVRVHAEPRVEHLVDDLISSQGLPFLLGAFLLLLLPILVERVAAAVARRRASSPRSPSAS